MIDDTAILLQETQRLLRESWDFNDALKKRVVELKNQLTECTGFDCCPLASKLNAADDRVELLEKERIEHIKHIARLQEKVK